MEALYSRDRMRTKLNERLNALVITSHPPVEKRIIKVLAKFETNETSAYTLKKMASIKAQGYVITGSKESKAGLIYIYEFALGENHEDVMERHIDHLEQMMKDFKRVRNLC